MLDIVNLAEQIKFHRTRLGLTQAALGEKLNVSYQAVSSWEKGTNLPDLFNIFALSKLFGISIDSLVQDSSVKEEVSLIAIDGGGTKTEVVLFTASGTVLKVMRLEGSNASDIGLERAISIHTTAIDACMKLRKDVRGIYIGCAGRYLDNIKEMLSQCYPNQAIFVYSDGLNALSTADADVALICGTGSILVRRSGDSYIKYGGWGHILGDPCSSYSFGKEALRAARAYEDGLESSHVIYELVLRKSGISNIQKEYKYKSVADVASYAPVLFSAYRLSDRIAQDIVQSEAKELSRFIFSAANEGETIVACGGVIDHQGAILLPILESYLNGYAKIITSALPPVYGASVECMHRMGIQIPENFESNFAETYQSALAHSESK